MQDVEDPKKLERLGNKQLLLQNIDYALDMFLIYVLTLSIFPGFLSEDTGAHSLGTWYVFFDYFLGSMISLMLLFLIVMEFLYMAKISGTPSF